MYPPILDESVQNNGRYYWKVLESVEAGAKYRIRIEAGDVSTDSNCFRIRASNEFSPKVVKALQNLSFTGESSNCNINRNKCLAINIGNLTKLTKDYKFLSEFRKTKAELFVYLYRIGINVKSLGFIDKNRGFVAERKVLAKEKDTLIVKFKKNSQTNVNLFSIVFANNTIRERLAQCKLTPSQQLMFIVNTYNEPQNVYFFGDTNQGQNQNQVIFFNTNAIDNYLIERIKGLRIEGGLGNYMINLFVYDKSLLLDLSPIVRLFDNNFVNKLKSGKKDIDVYLKKRERRILKIITMVSASGMLRYSNQVIRYPYKRNNYLIRLKNNYEPNANIYYLSFVNSKSGNEFHKLKITINEIK